MACSAPLGLVVVARLDGLTANLRQRSNRNLTRSAEYVGPGPDPPFCPWPVAAVQIHQTGHSSIAQHLLGNKVGCAQTAGIYPIDKRALGDSPNQALFDEEKEAYRLFKLKFIPTTLLRPVYELKTQ